MPEQLALVSDGWVAAFRDAAASWPARRGATGRVSITVVGGPEGKKAERAWCLTLADGQVTSVSTGADGDADVVLTQPWDDAVAVLRGDDAVDEAFMRGSTKLVGNVATFMDLLPVLRSAEWRAACDAVAARTAL